MSGGGSSSTTSSSSSGGGSGADDPITDYNIQTVYAKAQALGYQGSLEEFIETVSGRDGTDGKNGVDGATWLSGTSAPTNQTTANVGDFYFDEDDGDVYKKTANGWSKITNLRCVDSYVG